MADVFYVINVVISVYGFLLAIFGSLGNLICVVICLRKSLRKTPTFIFMAFMVIVDTISLYFWNFNDYFLTFFGKTMGDFSVEACRSSLLLQMASLESSAYLLVCISGERYLSARIKTWKTKYFKPIHAVIISVAIILFFFLIFNIHIAFTLTFSATNYTASNGACSASEAYKTWRPVHTYIYSIAPFIILVIINLLLVKQVLLAKSKVESVTNTSQRRRSMTISVVALTVSFIVFTLPLAVAGGYYTAVLKTTQSGRAILYICIEVSFTFHAANFLILFYSNKLFNKELKIVTKQLLGKYIREESTGMSTMTKPVGTTHQTH